MEIGSDILYIPKMREKINQASFIKKIYSEKEIELASQWKDPTFFYATRFAGKEAIMKATHLKYDFNEIEILKAEDGSPIVLLKDDAFLIKLSLSFDQDYAIAFCIAQKK